MRKFLALAAVLALAACGGGGGGGSTTTPGTPTTPGGGPTTAPSSKYVRPTFILKIPPKGSKAKWAKSMRRNPKYISSSAASVLITLTSTTNPVGTSLSGNPAETDISSIPGGCASGCTVNGPPSPPGTDSYEIQIFDAAGATGNVLNAGQLNSVTITAGQSNPETVILGAVPVSFSTLALPTWNAGTQSQTTALTVAAADADGNTIPTGQSPAVFYVDTTGAALNVTVTDPDTNAHGSCVATSGSSTCTSGAATSVTFSGPDGSAVFDYDGLAENPVTLTASAPTATSNTGSFQPVLQTPTFNAAAPGDLPAGVALTSGAEVDLFTTSGTGSTGTEYFTESGWTNSPYGQALTQTAGTCLTGTNYVATALSQVATMSVGTDDTTNGTPITATVAGTPSAGSCADTISDGLTSNSTEKTATLTVTYTTSSIGASAKHRKH